MSTEGNIAIVRRWYDETYNRKNLAAARELMSPGFVGHLHNIDLQGYIRSHAEAFERVPDFSAVIEDVVAAGDKVVVRVTNTATPQGELRTPWGASVSSNGKQCRWTEINIVRVVGGKVMGDWSVSESLSMWQQLGAIPMAGQAT